MRQAEIWREVVAEDTSGADAGIARRNEVEPPGRLDGFWTAGRGDIIHLVDATGGFWG
jgi:hypothetical protein